jgi:Mce-associated membrane protein
MSRKTPGSVQERASADAAESTADSTPDEQSRPVTDSVDARSAAGTSAESAVNTTKGTAEGDAALPEPEASEKDAAEPDAPAGEAGQRWPVRRVLAVTRRGLLPAVSVLAIAATVAAAFFGWKVKQHDDLRAASDAALAAARAYAVTLTSVDSNTLDRDFAAVLDGSTGEFRDMYTRSSGQLRELLVENKATGQGTVLDAAVKSVEETEVEVLLFIDQTVTNAASADPRIDRSRVVMTMQLVDGRWLAARVYLP